MTRANPAAASTSVPELRGSQQSSGEARSVASNNGGRRNAGRKRRSLKPRINLSANITRCGKCGFSKCQCEPIAKHRAAELAELEAHRMELRLKDIDHWERFNGWLPTAQKRERTKLLAALAKARGEA